MNVHRIDNAAKLRRSVCDRAVQSEASADLLAALVPTPASARVQISAANVNGIYGYMLNSQGTAGREEKIARTGKTLTTQTTTGTTVKTTTKPVTTVKPWCVFGTHRQRPKEFAL